MTIPAVYLITVGVAVGIALFAFFAQQQQHHPQISAQQQQHRPHVSAQQQQHRPHVSAHRNKSVDQDFVDDSAKCTICFEEIRSDLTYLDCRHAFHGQCVRQWLRISDTCPNCKKKNVTAM